MIELPPEQFAVARPVLERWLPHCVPAHAVLAGNNAGCVFVDNAARPTVAFMWTRWGYYYLAGESSNPAFNAALAAQLAHEFVPLSVSSGESGLILYPGPETWDDQIPGLLNRWAPVRIFRRTFVFNRGLFATHRAQVGRVPAGFSLRAIDAALFAHARPEISAALVAELGPGWAGVDDFLARGVGTCVVHGDPANDGTLASVCLSVMVSDRAAEVSVHTADGYRRQGLATLAAGAFVDQCLARGLIPSWECWWNNAASAALAQRLGFEMAYDHPVYYWEPARVADEAGTGD